MWRGRVPTALLDEYREYVVRACLPDYLATPGNRGAHILTRALETHGEIITLSFWEDEQSIAAFAGDDIMLARYYPEDKRYLLDFPECVEHFEAGDHAE